MLPDQPFYLSVNELRLNADISAQSPDLVSCSGRFSTTAASRSPSRMLLVHFDLKSDTSSLTGHTANVSVNGKVYHGLPFTMVNITELLSSSDHNELVFWCESIPTDVTVHVDEVKKVTEEELLQGINNSSTYVDKRDDTLALAAVNFTEEDHKTKAYLEVTFFCPLTKNRMRVPGRGARCQHLECFDVFAYLDKNESTLQPSWSCPVCGEQVLVQDLRVDLLMLDAMDCPDEDISLIIPASFRLADGDFRRRLHHRLW